MQHHCTEDLVGKWRQEETASLTWENWGSWTIPTSLELYPPPDSRAPTQSGSCLCCVSCLHCQEAIESWSLSSGGLAVSWWRLIQAHKEGRKGSLQVPKKISREGLKD